MQIGRPRRARRRVSPGIHQGSASEAVTTISDVHGCSWANRQIMNRDGTILLPSNFQVSWPESWAEATKDL